MFFGYFHPIKFKPSICIYFSWVILQGSTKLLNISIVLKKIYLLVLNIKAEEVSFTFPHLTRSNSKNEFYWMFYWHLKLFSYIRNNIMFVFPKMQNCTNKWTERDIVYDQYCCFEVILLNPDIAEYFFLLREQ